MICFVFESSFACCESHKKAGACETGGMFASDGAVFTLLFFELVNCHDVLQVNTMAIVRGPVRIVDQHYHQR